MACSAKMKRCVKDVEDKGMPKDSAYPICKKSVGENLEREIARLEEEINMKQNPLQANPVNPETNAPALEHPNVPEDKRPENKLKIGKYLKDKKEFMHYQ